MKVKIPDFSLVILVGASGSGKSRFARAHFQPTEVLSSDVCRGWVSDDENDQAATSDAFDVLHYVAAKRLAARRLTVIDATNVQREARRSLLALARKYHCLAVAVVLDLPERVCVERNRTRSDRNFGRRVVAQQRSQLRRSWRGLKREGFRYVYPLRTPEEVEAVTVERDRLWCDRRDEHGPFDLVGDVHGCAGELEALLEALGYRRIDGAFRHPRDRKAIFLGDVVDRGPRVLDAYRIVKAMVDAGTAMCLPGNHEAKLVRKLRGRNVKVGYGLERTLAELDALPEKERGQIAGEMADFFDRLVSHLVLDDGKLVVAHAGMKQEFQGRASSKVRDFALYGDTTGETDELGLPVRRDWGAEYRGRAMVVYGHTPVYRAEWLNRTINVDTGCVFGGRLTALSYPELELTSVDAEHVYSEPARPLEPPASALCAQHHADDLLDMEDVSGKRIVSTRLLPNVTVREENAAAALEAISRFAADPRWLIYLPPTMSPTATSRRPDLLEHPDEAFAAYAKWRVERAVCQEKHMGSRAVVIVCRDAGAARARFGLPEDEAAAAGVCFTRTGRRFFDHRPTETELIARVRSALDRSGLWRELDTDWVCLDCELMPWSAKARELLKSQYAAVGAAGLAATREAISLLTAARERGAEVGELLEHEGERHELLRRYRDAYRAYCWDVHGLADLKLAPFHLLASEGAVHVDKDHLWHMETLRRLCAEDGEVLLATRYRVVDLDDGDSVAAAVDWWTELTAGGGEGMVVKPLDYLPSGGVRRGPPVQPALKCRGREYLRIIYGPEYTVPANLDRLRRRGVSRKRSLATRELALGVEALERFVRREPLRRVHECVFGVLALESEPVDPRL